MLNAWFEQNFKIDRSLKRVQENKTFQLKKYKKNGP